MPTVADVVAQAITRERERCAAIMQEEADILLGSGEWQTAQTLERIAARLFEGVTVPAPTAVQPSAPTAPSAVDDDDADFAAVQRQVGARMLGSGYGRD